MKPNINQTKLDSNGVQDSVNFGIKDSGYAHIFHVLRNQLYSDSILAVVREYSCNAVDAHVEAGCGDRPIEVTIPTPLNLEFKVRDFGPALSDEEVRDVYAFYGESTKRETNDQTGMLGIGSKSAFSYGDNFVINSFLDGVKTTWNAFIDPSQVGQISKLSQESTNEENGIEIVIAVKDNDIEHFSKKAYDLFSYFKVKPIIKGAAQFVYTDKNLVFEGSDWKWFQSESRYSDDNATAIMGNIGYPIDRYSLNLSEDENEEVIDILRVNVDITFKIGDLDISASREKLQFTDKTRKAIVSKLKKVRKELLSVIQKQFSDCKTLWDAKCLIASVNDLSNGLYNLRSLISDGVTFNGQKVNGYSYATPEGVSVSQLKKPNRGFRLRLEHDWGRLQASDNAIVVVNDTGSNSGVLGRLLDLEINQQKKVWLIKFEDKKAQKAWNKMFDGPTTKLSSLPKFPMSNFYGASTRSSVTDKEHQKKINSKVFEYDFDADRYPQGMSGHWKASQVDENKSGNVYVIIDRFKLVGQRGYGNNNPRRINSMKVKFEKIGIDFPEKIYAFKVKDSENIKANSNFVDLWDWAKEQLENKIESDNLGQIFVDVQCASDNSQDWHRRNDSIRELLSLLLDNQGSMAKNLQGYLSMYHEDTRKNLDMVSEAAATFDIEINYAKADPSFDLKESNSEVMEKYSILDLLDWYAVMGRWANETNTKNLEKLADYINAIDICSIDG